jgi:hypothetical protein
MRMTSYFLVFSCSLFLSCTTYSITMVHSQGQATDLVDESQTQSPTADVKASLSVPASVVP